MKKLALCGLLMAACAFAQVSYDDLKQQIHSGSSPEAIKNAIQLDGIDFEVNITLLRTMKEDRLPDWLIDFLIDYDQTLWVSRSDAPRRYADKGDGDLVLNYNSYWGLSPWSCVNWYYYFCDPWSFCRYYGTPYYAHYGYAGLWGLGYYSYYYNNHYYYGGRGYFRDRGSVSPRGYRVRDRRIVGRAVPRGSTVARSAQESSRIRRVNTRAAVGNIQRGTRTIAKPGSSSRSRTTATRSSSSRSRSSATRSSSSRSRSSATRSSSSRSRSSATRSSSSRSRSSASRSSSSRSRSSASRSSSSRSRSSATRSYSSRSRSSVSRSSSSRSRSSATRSSSSRSRSSATRSSSSRSLSSASRSSSRSSSRSRASRSSSGSRRR